MDIRQAVEEKHGTPFDPNDPLMRKVSGPATIIRREHVAVPAAKQSGLRDAKVYLLTSKRTFSAAEHLSLALKRTKRATLVGEATGGGAHFGGMGPMGKGYAAFVPVGRTFDPDTGQSWEGTGVAPDVAVPGDKALDEALKLAGVQGGAEAALASLK
jgi:C-terminal processing protease CtpA/Prc